MKMIKYIQGPLFDAAPPDGGGGGGGTPAVFDPTAFRTQLLGDVKALFATFGASVKADLSRLTPPAPPAPVPPGPDPAPGPATGDGAKPPADAALTATIRAMERRLAEAEAASTALKTESAATKAAADKKELDAAVRTKLVTKFKFSSDAASEDAFEIFGGKVTRNDAGAFVGPDGTPLDQYLEEGMRAKPYLLAPKDVGGAGARGSAGAPGAKNVDFDSIKAGMSLADQAAAGAQIAAVLKTLTGH